MKKPRLRFKEFGDGWKNSKLSNLVEFVSGNNDNYKDIPILTISASRGWMKQSDRFDKVIAGNELKNYTLLKRGELSYNHGNSKLAKYGTVFELNNYDEALVPKVYHSFKTKSRTNPSFIEYLFETKKTDRELRKLVSSGARMDGLLNISKNSFGTIKINHPGFREQQKIGQFFQNLDQQIALQSDKLEALKIDKKGYLQKMFPSDGSNRPRLRFKGFNDDWRAYYLDELVNKSDEKRIPIKESDRKDGNTPYYGANGIQDHVKGYTHNGEYVLIAEDGANSIDNYPIYKTNGKIWVNNHAHVLQGKEQMADTLFMSYLLKTLNLRPYLTGSGRYKLNAAIMMKIKVKTSSYEEQKIIGMFLNHLDQQIDLQQQKITDLKNQKKAYLQKMFI